MLCLHREQAKKKLQGDNPTITKCQIWLIWQIDKIVSQADKYVTISNAFSEKKNCSEIILEHLQ